MNNIYCLNCFLPRTLYSFLPGTRGLDPESAAEAEDAVPKPITKRKRLKDGDSIVLSCPIRGTVHSPISWFRLPTSKADTQNLTATALGRVALASVAVPAAWLALKAEQVNLTSLLIESRGRISIDPAYHLIYAEVKSGSDASSAEDTGRIPVFRLACVHGDARGSNFKWSDWSGTISTEIIVRWSGLKILTGLGIAVSVLMPAFLSVATVLTAVKCLVDEKKPVMQAGALGHTPRPRI